MTQPDPLQEKPLKHLQLFFYLIPILGFFPAIWTLVGHQGSRQQKELSRQAVTLALFWLFGYILLETSAQTSEFAAIPLLLLSSLLTSGYFLASLWLMVRLWQRQRPRLPLIGDLSDRLP